MWFLILTSIIAFCTGILFLFSPKTLLDLSAKVSASINRVIVPIDEKVYKFRIGVGISLLLVAAMLIFVYYYLIKKYG